MDEDSQREPLRAHLDELGELFSSLLPDHQLGVAIYDRDRRRVALSGLDGLPAKLPAVLPEPPAASAQPHIHVSLATAYARVRAAAEEGGEIFAVCCSEPLPQHTLASLGRMGAGFLSRTLALLEQARDLRRVVKEQKAIFDHISDGLIVLDSSGILRHLNAPGGRILKLDPSRSIGRPFKDLIDFDPFINPILRTGVGYVDRELQIRTPRIDLHLMDTAVPILGEDRKVVSIVNTFREMARVKQLSNRLSGEKARYRFSDIIGHSRILKETVGIAKRSARSDANVLLQGESGTGKEVFAQAIHNDGRRVAGPFVAINCAAIPRDLIESEIFGYSAGSFTGADKSGRPGKFELASGGTIFLDEISEMPLDVQAKLLRVLQERQVTRIGATSSIAIDVRVIAAANRELRDLVERQSFREDLYYRLNVMRINLPALRERQEDIAALSDAFMRQSCAALHRRSIGLTPRAVGQLEAYHWPGNLRQLQNVIERLVNLVDADTVDVLPTDWLDDGLPRPSSFGEAVPPARVMTLDEAERMAVRIALEATGLNVTRAAAALGITRATLYAKMKRHGLETVTQLAGGEVPRTFPAPAPDFTPR
jgi:transcriptional regulator with PAS, ATPase and Fis domain